MNLQNFCTVSPHVGHVWSRDRGAHVCGVTGEQQPAQPLIVVGMQHDAILSDFTEF